MKFQIYFWKLPALHDLQLTLKNFGKEVHPVKVFEICHPGLSSKILEKSDERIASVMMPCRISVYMKHNGKTFVSLINTAGFAQNTGHLIHEVMMQASAGAEQIVKNA